MRCSAIAAYVQFDANVAARAQTSREDGLLVSGTYFMVLGLQPALGRLLTPDDDKAIGESHVAVLSHPFWQTRFGSDPAVLGQPIVVNGQSLTVVGVGPRGFSGTTIGETADVFVPITLRDLMQPPGGSFEGRRYYWAYLFARLKPEVTRQQASIALTGAYRAILAEVEAPLQKGLSLSNTSISSWYVIDPSPRRYTCLGFMFSTFWRTRSFRTSSAIFSSPSAARWSV